MRARARKVVQRASAQSAGTYSSAEFRLRLLFRKRIRSSVTSSAVFRRGLVEQNGFSVDDFGQLMALWAADILMRPAQRESGPLLVIEQRRLPLHAVVTL